MLEVALRLLEANSKLEADALGHESCTGGIYTHVLKTVVVPADTKGGPVDVQKNNGGEQPFNDVGRQSR